MPTDTERLNWLESEARKRPVVLDGGKFAVALGGDREDGPSLRASIDAEMAADGVQQPDGGKR